MHWCVDCGCHLLGYPGERAPSKLRTVDFVLNSSKKHNMIYRPLAPPLTPVAHACGLGNNAPVIALRRTGNLFAAASCPFHDDVTRSASDGGFLLDIAGLTLGSLHTCVTLSWELLGVDRHELGHKCLTKCTCNSLCLYVLCVRTDERFVCVYAATSHSCTKRFSAESEHDRTRCLKRDALPNSVRSP